jgi:RNA polymerase sigma factor (sigma-70 family)
LIGTITNRNEIVTGRQVFCTYVRTEHENQGIEEIIMASALAPSRVKDDAQGRAEDLSDGGLLERFLTGDEAKSQEAFRALVESHGPMVLGICRHILNEEHDAEDAFQATFLVLAQKAGSIRNRLVLAGWLHEVAHRIAVKARVSAQRRRTLERQVMAMSPAPIESNGQNEAAAWNELRPVLHDEVGRLPEKYRLPVILCYLEGKTNEEAAELLHWPVGTVKGRLSRARDVLRTRLMRRGLVLSAAFLLTALSRGRVFAEMVPAELVKNTVVLARRFGPRGHGLAVYSGEPEPEPASGRTLPARVAALSQSVLRARRAWWHTRWLLILILVLTSSVGVCLAATTPKGLAGLGSALSSLLPARVFGGSSTCHPDRDR